MAQPQDDNIYSLNSEGDSTIPLSQSQGMPTSQITFDGYRDNPEIDNHSVFSLSARETASIAPSSAVISVTPDARAAAENHEQQDTATQHNARSWIYVGKWARKRTIDKTHDEVSCLYPGCKKKYKVKRMSTGNMTQHLTNYHKLEKSQVNDGEKKGPIQRSMEHAATRPAPAPITRDDFMDALVMFVVNNKLAISIVEDPSFQNLLNIAHLARSDDIIKLPKKDSFRNKINAQFMKYEEKMRMELLQVPKLSFTIDGWTSRYQDSFVGVTAHWISDTWQYKEVLLGFEHLTGSHTGEALKNCLVKVLRRFGLQKKILAITADNASNVNSMMEHLERHTLNNPEEWNPFDSQRNRVACVAHIIHLAVQELLGPNGLKAPAELEPIATGSDDSDSFVAFISGDLGGTVEDAPSSLSQDMEEDREKIIPYGPSYISAHGNPLEKLREGIKRIRFSSQRLFALKSKCQQDHCHLTVILDCSTRWSSTYEMLQRALLLKDAYSGVCSDDNRLSAFNLDRRDWEFISNLCELLSSFAYFTQKLSSSRSYASIPLVISAYNKLIDKIEQYRESPHNRQHFSDICKAALRAKFKLQKYYTKTDLSAIYAIGTALHPRRKFHWWNWKQWEEHYQDEAKEAVTKVWREDYEPYAPTRSTPISFSHIDSDDDFNDLEPQDKPSGSELMQYVADKATVDMEDVTAVIQWWRDVQEKWPTLSQMARDYLAIPATSTPSERVFSQARLNLPHTRNRMSPDTLSMLLKLGAWQKYFH